MELVPTISVLCVIRAAKLALKAFMLGSFFICLSACSAERDLRTMRSPIILKPWSNGVRNPVCRMSAIAAIMIRMRPIKNAILDTSANENGAATVAMYQPRIVKKNKETFHFILRAPFICNGKRDLPEIPLSIISVCYSDTFSAHFR